MKFSMHLIKHSNRVSMTSKIKRGSTSKVIIKKIIIRRKNLKFILKSQTQYLRLISENLNFSESDCFIAINYYPNRNLLFLFHSESRFFSFIFNYYEISFLNACWIMSFGFFDIRYFMQFFLRVIISDKSTVYITLRR